MKRIVIPIILFFTVVVTGLYIGHLKTSSPQFDNLNQELHYLVSHFVEQDTSVKNCVLSVMKGDGSFSWTGAAGIACQDDRTPMTADTSIYIASITKLYTAAAIMKLHEQGVLSLDDPMAKYLPDKLIQGIHVYEGEDYSLKITIKELLSHTSGIADYYAGKSKDGKRLFDVFLENPARLWTVEETIARARNDLEPNFSPGTDASYSDTNFQLLGKIIEAVTGKPLHVVYEKFFFQPLELTHTWLVGHSVPASSTSSAPADVFCEERNITRIRGNGSYWADGGIVSTAEECILFLKALNEGRVLKPDTVTLMHQWHKLHFPIQYGYGTMYFKFPGIMRTMMNVPPLWGHSGSTGSFLYYSEDADLYLAGTIDQTESKIKPFRLMGKVMKAIEKRGRIKQRS